MESVPPLGLLRTELAKLLSEVKVVEEVSDWREGCRFS